MKLDVNLSELIACAERMGSFVPDFAVEVAIEDSFELDTSLSSTAGLEIGLDELEIEQGLLGYRGRQVLLFIPDHGSRAGNVLAGRSEGNKFHVADCQKLDEMRSKQRFERYKATYNVSGKFEIFGTLGYRGEDVSGEAELHVCKLCLGYLNYRGYKNSNKAAKDSVYDAFDISEFLSKYSTLFRSMPKREALVDMAGYVDNWKEISRDFRQSHNWSCDHCNVNLQSHPALLHTHHINGVKRDNRPENLKALCIDCHRKQPQHDYMRVTHAQMQELNRLRKEQSLLCQDSWDELIELADTSVTDLLRHYRLKSYAKPVVGHELQADSGEVIAMFELAWPDKQKAIAIDYDAISLGSQYGWRVISVGEAIKRMNQ
ncbi:HNH endonuclease [Bacterioplanes sanyensis]|uniref:HNH endonuclease n=1 Tax=Bacterioplanes sanyensis TaxID=1249553 RepID=UPI001676DAB6|nr:HNH endonuclease [Bacterioplanes sanyensis]GGY39046.1 HNH endonuclease [Bacterioplanes sanyensis]